MMKLAVAALMALAISTPAFAQVKAAAPPHPTLALAKALSPEMKPKPIALTRVKAQMSAGQTVGILKGGVVCTGSLPIAWKTVAPSFSGLKDIFGEELKAAGFKPDRDPGSLFSDPEGSQTDLQVGALFKSADIAACETPFHFTVKVKLAIEWQIYSSLRREVVATVETLEGAEMTKELAERIEGRSAYQEAFAANVRSLLSNDSFRKVVTAPSEAPPSAVASATGRSPIDLIGATTGPTAIPDAVGSVVTVFAGNGFGSGVLVSSDGYVLTNHHVVGTSTEVRLRWSDGFETTGHVIRSDKRRDVALVQTNSRGRTPLALRRASPPPGTPVYAIGAPLDPKLQSTVTRGIVSANRIVDGFSFIQSDTPVTHGNSGGPLLDERGAVIGLTDWGVPAQEGSSLNFFIPIGDALDFLALKSGS